MYIKDNGRIIPKKNYLCLFLIILFSFMIIFYGYLWYKSYRESLLQNSIMDDYLNTIQYNELDDYVMENKDVLVYVSVLGDEKINDFEVNFVNTIRDYSLRDSILYMNVSDIDKSVVDNKFGSGFGYPYIVVYTNGKVSDIYMIANKKYNTKNIVKYLNRIGVIEDD